MLTVHNLSKSYDLSPVLDSVSFNLNPGERLGLIGPNGCGKTTLLRILAGLEQPDRGSFHLDPPNLRLGYLPQGLVNSPDFNLAGETLRGYLARQVPNPQVLLDRLEALAARLAQGSRDPALQAEYDSVLAELQHAEGESARLPGVLAPLGLDHLPGETPVAHLSGGQKTRLALAGVLLAAPRLLLLDEPTNHLDIDMLTWLEDWLGRFRGAALVISHDRALLDRVATGILELDAGAHTLRAFPGNYTAYLEQKIGELERRWQEYNDQQSEIAQLRRAAAQVRHIARFRKGGKGDSGDKFARGFFANRTKGTIARARHLEHRLELLLTDQKIDKPKRDWQMKLDFSGALPSGRSVLSLSGVTIGYPGLPLLEGVDLQVQYGARVAVIGPNGAGKTSLLRTIHGTLPPLAGEVRLGSSVRLGYMAQEQEDLDLDLNALAAVLRLAPFSETDARAFLHQFLFSGDDVFIPIRSLSYGERARLSLASLVASGCNLLLLDEPVNHLDIPSRARFEQALAAYPGTVITVTHDRFFIEGFAAQVWELVPLGIGPRYALKVGFL